MLTYKESILTIVFIISLYSIFIYSFAYVNYDSEKVTKW